VENSVQDEFGKHRRPDGRTALFIVYDQYGLVWIGSPDVAKSVIVDANRSNLGRCFYQNRHPCNFAKYQLSQVSSLAINM
jgi:hypothetical protein